MHQHSTRGALALIALSFGMFPGCARVRPDAGASLAQPTHDARVAWEGEAVDAPWPVVVAAWRDITASVHRAGSDSGFAVTDIREPSTLEREYTLVGNAGQPGLVRVTASRVVEGAVPGDPWISFQLRLGTIGDPPEEARMREAMLRFRPKHAR